MNPFYWHIYWFNYWLSLWAPPKKADVTVMTEWEPKRYRNALIAIVESDVTK